MVYHIRNNMSETGEIIQAGIIGKVKWFNNKAGYGFITVSAEGDYMGKDIFTHYSAIKVTNSQYKYLVQGEYVQFDLEKSTSGSHEYKAISVTGINGGELMCETRVSSRKVVSDDFTQVKRKRASPRQQPSNDA